MTGIVGYPPKPTTVLILNLFIHINEERNPKINFMKTKGHL